MAADAVSVDLFVELLAAKLGHEFATRVGQPALFGEVLAGVLVGPAVLGWVELSEVLEAFAQFGAVVLLFWAGLETRLEDMRAVGRSALSVGAVGMVVPFAAGMGVGLAIGESFTTSLFIAAVFMATSAGITAAVLDELDLLTGTAGRTILVATVVDDILALVIVGVAVGVSSKGEFDVVRAMGVRMLAIDRIAFVVFSATVGTSALRRRPDALGLPRFAESTFIPGRLAVPRPRGARIGHRPGRDRRRVPGRDDGRRDARPSPRRARRRAALRAVPLVLLHLHRRQHRSRRPRQRRNTALLVALTALSFAVKFFACWLAARPLGREDALI